jgi:hypothetical protein
MRQNFNSDMTVIYQEILLEKSSSFFNKMQFPSAADSQDLPELAGSETQQSNS